MNSPLFKKVLLAVDDSEQSRRAVEKAIYLAQAGFVGEIVLFNVYNTSDIDITKLHNQDKIDELKAKSQNLLDKYQSLLKEHSITCEAKRVGGDPASQILDIVDEDQEFELIIMGSRRLNKLQELVFGSVTDKVTRLTSIPVLVIK